MEKNWFNYSIDDIEKKLKTNINLGLNNEQVEKSRGVHGFNELKAKKKKVYLLNF